MIVLIGQIVGCLLVAAAIGGITGWFLRRLSVNKLNQHVADVTTALKIKEQALHWAQLDVKTHATTVESYESRLRTADALAQTAQQELASSSERLRAAQEELSVATQRLSLVESESQAPLQQGHDIDVTITAYAQEVRQANAGRTAAQQELAASVEELRAIQEELSTARQRLSLLESEAQASLQRDHDHAATIEAYAQEARQANAGRTAAQQELNETKQALLQLQNRLTKAEPTRGQLDRLRAQVAEMEPAQGRMHWLEVQLTEKDVHHRAALHERDEQHAAQLAMIQKEAHATLAERDRELRENAQRVAALQRQFEELRALQVHMADQAPAIEKKKKDSAPLQKPFVETRTALAHPPGDKPGSSQASDQIDSQLHLHIDQPTIISGRKKETLKKNQGRGSVIEAPLN
jgi:chromosome segregation ATPase